MSEPTRLEQPIILIRGFGGLDTADEKLDAYQRFNVGTVYPQKQGENYIYEGMVLRLMKSNWKYQDATNVVGYYSKKQDYQPLIPPEMKKKYPNLLNKFKDLERKGYFSGDRIVINPDMAFYLLRTIDNPLRTLWVFRYYDLDDRKFETYGKALVRLIDFIRELTVDKIGEEAKVNIIAHSMGGLIVREAVQRTYPQEKGDERAAEKYINKIVTLGTPHRGITFQLLKDWLDVDALKLLLKVEKDKDANKDAEKEIEAFNPDFQEDETNPVSYKNFHKHFPLNRLLTVVGTNYRSYGPDITSRASSGLNRLFSMPGEFGPTYNRSDGLVKQTSAQIPGTPRTFVHKCHGGNDSLITSREAFEIATRFFFGNTQVRLLFVKGKATLGMDLFGKSEFFFGVSIKPRRVDFELFNQSKDAENCYGPFTHSVSDTDNHRSIDFSEPNDQLAFPWADENKLIWEGYLDTSAILDDESITEKDMVMRLGFYVGERDLFGIGFSDNVIFSKQYFVRALLKTPLELYLHTNDREGGTLMRKANGGWEFEVSETGFEGTFRIELDEVPEIGQPVSFA
ncbi:hypothetical protein [Allocoleopsis sp.]|uniref:esterase/lipase family protein n=1 Tax=Allocoleopsis sp. TaxID=3088169 RepID=UPI002FD1E5FD